MSSCERAWWQLVSLWFVWSSWASVMSHLQCSCWGVFVPQTLEVKEHNCHHPAWRVGGRCLGLSSIWSLLVTMAGFTCVLPQAAPQRTMARRTGTVAAVLRGSWWCESLTLRNVVCMLADGTVEGA